MPRGGNAVTLAVVTGANSAVGCAITKRLAQDFGEIVATFHERHDRLEQLASSHANVTCHGPFDITRAPDIDRLKTYLRDRGSATAVVNGASFAASSLWHTPLMDVGPHDFLTTFAVDVVGTLQLIQGLRKYLTENASIVLFGSAGATRNDLDTAVYNPAKMAVSSLGLHLAKELSPQVRVNVLEPGAIGEEWVHLWQVPDEEVRDFKAIRGGMRRFGTPEELAEVVAFLVSSSSGYVNGQTIKIDGGSQT